MDSHIAASDRLDYLYLKNMLSDIDCTDRTELPVSPTFTYIDRHSL